MAVYYRRLVDAGKKKPVAVNIVKNKLLHIITAMIRKGERYNPDHDYYAALKVA
jgi:hypothetical protein